MRASASIGLVRCCSKPASSALRSSRAVPYPVKATRVRSRPYSARSLRASSWPSIPGNPMSSTAILGRSRRMRSRAVGPSPDRNTRCPRRSSAADRVSRASRHLPRGERARLGGGASPRGPRADPLATGASEPSRPHHASDRGTAGPEEHLSGRGGEPRGEPAGGARLPVLARRRCRRAHAERGRRQERGAGDTTAARDRDRLGAAVAVHARGDSPTSQTSRVGTRGSCGGSRRRACARWSRSPCGPRAGCSGC